MVDSTHVNTIWQILVSDSAKGAGAIIVIIFGIISVLWIGFQWGGKWGEQKRKGFEEQVKQLSAKLREMTRKEEIGRGEVWQVGKNLEMVKTEIGRREKELQEQINIIQGEEKAKIRIWNYPEYYQVIVRLFQDIPLTAKIEMVSSKLPPPREQHQCDIPIKPGDEDFTIIDARI